MRRTRFVVTLLMTVSVSGCIASQLGTSDPAVQPGHENDFLDFTSFTPSPAVNRYLVLPPYFAYYVGPPPYYNMPTPDAHSPRFPVPASQLADAIAKAVGDEQQTEILERTPDGLQIEAQQKSTVGFVDRISALAIPIDEHSSTIALYSRSTFGYFGFGVNESRAKRLMAAVTSAAGGSQPIVSAGIIEPMGIPGLVPATGMGIVPPSPAGGSAPQP